MTATAVLMPIALIGSGLTAGTLVSTVLGITPFTLVLPYDRYVETIRFMWPRYDPFMPITNAVTFLLDVLLVIFTDGILPRLLLGVAAALLLAVMGISVSRNLPINRYVSALDPHHPPPEWPGSDPRRQWAGWNRRRTVLAVLALAANAAAAGILI